jgi:ubiquitin-like 1-activating enzyme E1 A
MALTENEAEIYDRQIRLWGVEAQQRMTSSKICVSGLGAIGAECTKNLILAGMNVVMQDIEHVSEADLWGQFFVTKDNLGQNVSNHKIYFSKNLFSLLFNYSIASCCFIETSKRTQSSHIC